MTESQRNIALDKVQKGGVPILVCTAYVEEGLDVSTCEVVIRLSRIHTSKDHIQSSGPLESGMQRCTTLTMTRRWNAERQQKRNRLHSRT